MGTRSLTVIKDFWEGNGKVNEQEIVVMYRQVDGYPEEHGRDLATFLDDMYIVNGLGANQPAKIANGASCLAAQIVVHFKNMFPVGGIYLHPAGSRDMWEEWVYEVNVKEGEGYTLPHIRVFGGEEGEVVAFEGTAKEMLEWIDGQQGSL